MLVQLLEKLLDLKRPEVIEIEGRKYSTSDIKPVNDPVPSTLEVHSLAGVVEFLTTKPHDADENAMVHVEGPSKVSVVTPLVGVFKRRGVYLTASHGAFNFAFGQYHHPEKFIVELQSQFVADAGSAAVLKLASSVTDVGETTVNDDGITQNITAKAGVVTLGKGEVKNPFRLTPRRSFPDIEQVSSDFILRIQKDHNGVKFGLFEADGGAWANTARDRIKAHLSKALENRKVFG